MLTDWITPLLQWAGRPLKIDEIVDHMNSQRTLNHDHPDSMSASELRTHIENFPSQFTVINGWVVSSEDKKWSSFISAISYMAAVLGGTFRSEELQFVISGIILYKRMLDFRDTSKYSIEVPETAGNFMAFGYAKKAETNFYRSLLELEHSNKFSIPIFTDLVKYLRRLPPGTLTEVAGAVHTIDTTIFSDIEFSIAFEYILDIRNFETRRKPSLIRTPEPIAELMVALLAPNGGTVFDPMCGTGSLLTRIAQLAQHSMQLTGLEIDERAARFAFMNLLICTQGYPEIYVKNCFDELFSDQRYDYIVSDLPIAPVFNPDEIQLLGQIYELSIPRNNKGFAASVLYVLAKLSRHGKAVLTVSEAFLSSNGIDEKVRNILIQEDIIEAVVSLPINSLRPYSNGKASIIILNKSKPSYLIGRVKFIEVVLPRDSKKNVALDISEIIRKYKSKTIDEKGVQLVELDRISSMNTLQVAFYSERFHQIGELLSDKGGVPLGDLVEIKRGIDLLEKEDANHQEGTAFVRIENLERDILDMGLSLQGLRSFIADTYYYEKAIISKEAILVARIGDNLKPTYFKPSRNIPQIIAHTNVLVLYARPDVESVNFEYLYYQLYSVFVQKQIERKRQGAIMPFISIKSMKSLIIPFMGGVAQGEFVATQKSNIITAEREKVNQRLKSIGFEERDIQKESDIVSTLVHELRPKLVSIHSVAEKLSRIIVKHRIADLTEYEERGDGDLNPELADIIESPENVAIGDLSKKLIKSAGVLSETLSVVQKVMNFALKREDFKAVDILQLLKEYFASKKDDINGVYRYDVRGMHLTVSVHPHSFEQILDQLMANAIRHAFKSPSASNHVLFNVREDKDRRMAVIEYSNNGEAFALTEKDFIGFFHKSKSSDGSGIGGNFIYRVVKAHGGDLRIREGGKKGFFITIELPLWSGEL